MITPAQGPTGLPLLNTADPPPGAAAAAASPRVATDANGQTAAGSDQHSNEPALITESYAVAGMTCGHCVDAVTGELKAFPGVTHVNVELVAGGTSTVTVGSYQTVDRAQVATAVEQAGGYQLV